MGWIDSELGRIATGQNRIVTTDQLRDRGVTRRQVKWLRATGRMEPVHRGVYVVGAGPLDFIESATAACLARPDAVLSHSSAGYLYGVRKSATERLEVTIPTGMRCDLPQVKVHRSNRLDPEDVFHRLDGVRLTSPERLLFDQAGVLDAAELRSAIHHAVHLELVTPASLGELAGRLVVRGRRGSREFGRAVLELDGPFVPAESDGELRLARAAEAAGLLGLVRQHWVALATGARVRIDVAVPHLRLGLEFDHSHWHAIPSRVQADKARDVQLRRIRWTILRFSEIDLARPTAVTRAIADVYVGLTRRAA